jgi:hypothetical protein
VSDHFHYADEIHGAAQEHHRHYDMESEIRGLREDLNRALARISDLEAAPGRQAAELEAADAMADLYSSGYLEEEPELEDYDPGPEVDDEGGMSEYRHAGMEEPW